LDHVLVSDNLNQGAAPEIDIVHVDTDFAASTRASDDDPIVTRFTIEAGEVIAGGSGSQTLIGGSGGDTVSGGSGKDVLDGTAGNDLLHGDNGNDMMVGGFGNDTLVGGSGADLLSGGIDGDSLAGGAGNDTLFGGDHADRLDGNNGNDQLDGGSGDDTVSGGAGNDLLSGGEGSDLLNGGSGNDTFDFDNLGQSLDTIVGFKASSDSLDISDLLDGFGPQTSDIEDFVQLAEGGGDTVVRVDADGGGDSFQDLVVLDGVTGLNLDSLVQTGAIEVAASA
jgi:Ca2+-binding RTX toxin-like protein